MQTSLLIELFLFPNCEFCFLMQAWYCSWWHCSPDSVFNQWGNWAWTVLFSKYLCYTKLFKSTNCGIILLLLSELHFCPLCIFPEGLVLRNKLFISMLTNLYAQSVWFKIPVTVLFCYLFDKNHWKRYMMVNEILENMSLNLLFNDFMLCKLSLDYESRPVVSLSLSQNFCTISD